MISVMTEVQRRRNAVAGSVAAAREPKNRREGNEGRIRGCAVARLHFGDLFRGVVRKLLELPVRGLGGRNEHIGRAHRTQGTRRAGLRSQGGSDSAGRRGAAEEGAAPGPWAPAPRRRRSLLASPPPRPWAHRQSQPLPRPPPPRSASLRFACRPPASPSPALAPERPQHGQDTSCSRQ